MRLRDRNLRSRTRTDSDPAALGVQCEGQIIYFPWSTDHRRKKNLISRARPGFQLQGQLTRTHLPRPFLNLTYTSLPEETKLSEPHPAPMESGKQTVASPYIKDEGGLRDALRSMPPSFFSFIHSFKQLFIDYSMCLVLCWGLEL